MWKLFCFPIDFYFEHAPLFRFPRLALEPLSHKPYSHPLSLRFQPYSLPYQIVVIQTIPLLYVSLEEFLVFEKDERKGDGPF
jgi:hypothetical protein